MPTAQANHQAPSGVQASAQTQAADQHSCDCTAYCGDDDRLRAGTVRPCSAQVMALQAVRRRDMATTLLAELEYAHGLITLLLQHLTPAARGRFAIASERAGLGTDGATRHHERAAALAMAAALATATPNAAEADRAAG